MQQELKTLLKEIYEYNEKYFQTVSSTEKIDFSKTKKTTGTEIIPKEYWINTQKKYMTESNQEVIIYDVKIFDEHHGKEYTFPVKGAYLKKYPHKKDKWINSIWTLDGRINVFEKDLDNPLNLKEFKNVNEK